MAHNARSVPVALQLWDKATSKHVKATVRLPSGIAAASLELPHVGDGYYCTDQVPFPSVDFVTVFYQVFDDAALSTLSQDHGEAFEVFQSVASQAAAASSGFEDLVALVDDVQLSLVAVVEQTTVVSGG